MGVFLKTGPWHQSLSFLRKLPMYNILNFFVSGIQGLYMTTLLQVIVLIFSLFSLGEKFSVGVSICKMAVN